ncbi:hypothetical protein [Mesorhizobium sp. CO1-1-8]|uniref:hypothetical protein n=1 Tax=Mesorhizobium sp. CO1-1-8 TaxID=2876631 RepID=UPI001CD0FA1C|nr:hypothetical protein [Mesorhizobium sp. CO1-1-8]MBZ9775005.1 hypothetical protein [Mesorhizobium sp. CO1-1-8]
MPDQDLSIFDLDALRDAFMKSVRENNVTAAEWGEHAEQFIRQLADQGLTEVAANLITRTSDKADL